MMQRQPISVSVLANYLKNILDAETMLYNVEVIGEVSSFVLSGKNAYFTIKDENALLNCVLFDAGEFFTPKIGDKIIVTGTPRYYVKGGKLNLNAINIAPFGEGDIYKRFIELKNRLEKEGLFDIAHKKPMPSKINRIGVVTSETGAVIHDIINVVTRRNSAQDIVLYPIKVQGIGADKDIADGINFFSEYAKVDAIIVGRGGGSEEDLQNFNSEIVARAIYNCKKFVISAVGHETDFTICDYAADLRAPTPSAAAELLTKDGGERKQTLNLIMQNITNIIEHKLILQQSVISAKIEQLNSAMQTYLSSYEQELQTLSLRVKGINPLEILKHGYARVENGKKTIISTKEVKVGDSVNIYFADGKANAEIKGVEINGLRKKH